LPESNKSPLSKQSRSTLTRHLLPMLWEVAAHESGNKMNPENLGICFSMCLVCGSNQLEDAKIASVLKRILQAAIEMWPELQAGMTLSTDRFFGELQPPLDSRDYEDPLEEELPPRSKRVPDEDELYTDSREDHRIVMDDTEDVPAPERAPTLPPRRPRTEEQKGLPMQPRPSKSQDISPVTPGSGSDGPPPVPKRKPAPPIVEPPRYSTIFGTDGQSLSVADSPATYGPVDGFGPPRHGAWSYEESEKKGFAPQLSDLPPKTDVPKRRPVSTEFKQRNIATPSTEPTPSHSRTPSDSASLAEEAAQKAASTLAQQATAAFAARSDTATVVGSADSGSPTLLQSPESIHNEGDNVFRKPSWPASARPIQSQSLAKPVVPPRQSRTFPSPTNGNLTAPGTSTLKPRAPSPGLLKRMASIEGNNAGTGATPRDSEAQAFSGASLQPRKLDLRKPSVEGLRRLYEERVGTAQVLARTEAARRGSTPD